jgi:4'-phosphopantetheinyl transferase EntD
VIEEILPPAVVAVEARDDRAVALHPEEEASLGRPVDKRRREFTTARACAREAFERLGVPPAAVPSGERGEPRWPAGVVGSITHCDGFRACAIARAEEVAAIGIDAEPNQPLPDGVLAHVARPEELPALRELGRERPETCWDRLLFSAKESIYKTWFPLTELWLGFEDAVVELDPDGGAFSARLLVPGPVVAGEPLERLSGRWLARDGLVLTAVTEVA